MNHATAGDAPEVLAAEAGRYWSRSSSTPWIRDLSHWRGQGRWSDDRTWRAIGERHFDSFQELCATAHRPRPIRSMVEWGPGGGANAVAFAREVAEFYGVDISEANLAECGEQLSRVGFAGWRPVKIDAGDPRGCLSDIKRPVDFFLSTAVFQHFPGKAYGAQVMRIAHELLAPRGIALVSIRYDDGSEALRQKDRDYAKNAITFTSYGVKEFAEIARTIGFEVLSMTLSPDDCYAAYGLVKG
jgi:cyclopropane fatty-acyl-phospholipid synthase-like methyltransferase